MKRTLRAVGLGLVLVGTVAHAGPDDAPAATKPYASPDGLGSLTLPSDWTVRIAEKTHEWNVLHLVADVPGASGPLELLAFRLQGMRTERGQAYQEREEQPKKPETKGGVAQVQLAPAPYVTVDIPSERDAWTFRVIHRVGFSLHWICARADWDHVAPSIFEATKSFSSNIEEWPARPAGFRAVLRDGYEYLLHPAVKDKDIDPLHKNVLEQEARYAKFHGAVTKSPDNPIVIVVHAKMEDAAPVNADAARGTGNGVSEMEARLFTVPLKKGPGDYLADLDTNLVKAIHTQSFGSGMVMWLYTMDYIVAWNEGYCGKPVPEVAENVARNLPRRPRTFSELIAAPSFDEAARGELFVYGALFRCGAKPWTDAFAAFATDVAADGDAKTALDKRLLSLDQAKLRDAAQEFVKSGLKPIKTK